MKITVIIVCQECHRVREVVVDGPEAVVQLEHDCDADQAYVVEAGRTGEQLALAA